jgi:molybdopterin-guanine dinucleotide biosynthesis protein A
VTTNRRAAGAVLTGGRSSRMGRDKALLPVDGVAMAARVAGALTGAGCDPVLAVGGDLAALAALGLVAVADPRQGDGPLAGIVSALEAVPAASAVVAVCACDLPALAAEDVAAVVAAASGGAAAVAWTGRIEPLCAAWPRARALDAGRALLGAGERAVQRLVERLDHVLVPVPAEHLRNVNRPGDLPPH